MLCFYSPIAKNNLEEMGSCIASACRIFYFHGLMAGKALSEIESLESMLNDKENKDTEFPKP